MEGEKLTKFENFIVFIISIAVLIFDLWLYKIGVFAFLLKVVLTVFVISAVYLTVESWFKSRKNKKKNEN